MTMQYSAERKKYERELIGNISDNTVYRLRKSVLGRTSDYVLLQIPLMYT